MTNWETLFLTILVMENLFFGGLMTIWLTRHCQQCQKVKCLERIFNQLCSKCQPQPKKKEAKPEMF